MIPWKPSCRYVRITSLLFGLDLLVEKSAVVIFTRHRLSYVNHITLGNVLISWKSYKYWGIFLDQKLTWDQHINMILKKAEKDLNILKYTTNRKLGADPTLSQSFYKSCIRLILDFCAILYGSAIKFRLFKADRLLYKLLYSMADFP